MPDKNNENKILIDSRYDDETRVVISKNGRIENFDYENDSRMQIKGNIYLAKITRVEPSLQAAFIEYGNDKHGFLPFTEIHPDYYNIPAEDKDALSGDLIKEEGISSENTHADDLTDLQNLNNKLLQRPEFSAEEQEEENQISSSENPEDEDVEKIVTNAENGQIEDGDEESQDLSKDDREKQEKEKRKRYNDIIYRYKIQDVIKKNQVILVQATKEDRGTKSASFTTYISLAGRYSVLMPNSFRQSGVSRRIDTHKERERMKEMIDSLSIKIGASVIVRTAGLGRNAVEIKRDYDYLVRLWNHIVSNTLKSRAPAFIHQEGDLITRAIRDLFKNDIGEIVVDGESAYHKVISFMKMLVPNHKCKIINYRNKTPIFAKHSIETQLASLYSPITHLNSGGYIVINQTEAMVSIDVNSGKSTGERSIEETATRTNLEAVIEIARQLKLTDMSGLIVIDFIDMEEYKNKRSVENLLRKIMQNDKARTQIRPIGPFGLLEMSRQMLRSNLISSNTKECQNCLGRGFVREDDVNAKNILRTIETELVYGNYEKINIFCHEKAAFHILNTKRHNLELIEKRYDVKISIFKDENASSDSFSIETERKKKSSPVKKSEESLTNVASASYHNDEPSPSNNNAKNPAKRVNSKEGKTSSNHDSDNKGSENKSLENNNSSGKKWQKIEKKELSPSDGAAYEDQLLEESIENIVPATPKSRSGKRGAPRKKPTNNNNNSATNKRRPTKNNTKLKNNNRRTTARKKTKSSKEGSTGLLKGLWNKLTN